jgi:hypothetical protein
MCSYPTKGTTLPIQPMHVEHYEICRECGAGLETTTVYRRHAYCVTCDPGEL